jgi:hypothetical protein
MGRSFENNGVTAKLPPTYLWGSAVDQLKRVAQAGRNIFSLADDAAAGVVAIWPKGGSRTTPNPPLISPTSGMIGYPGGVSNFMMIGRSTYTPNLRIGGLIQVQSSVTPAARRWLVFSLEHLIESEVYRGQWASRFQCTDPTAPQPTPQPA